MALLLKPGLCGLRVRSHGKHFPVGRSCLNGEDGYTGVLQDVSIWAAGIVEWASLRLGEMEDGAQNSRRGH